MIRSYRNEAARAAWARRFIKGVPQEVLRIGKRKLMQLHSARTLADLRAPPGNRLEALTGDRRGQHSMRINAQWRVCFVWRDGDAHEVEIVDYHSWAEMRCKMASDPDDHETDFPPIHPGEVLREDFLHPLGMSQYALAKALAVPEVRISEIVNGKRAITPDTALRLGRYMGTSAEFWLGMQMTYELERAREALGAKIDATVEPRAA